MRHLIILAYTLLRDRRVWTKTPPARRLPTAADLMTWAFPLATAAGHSDTSEAVAKMWQTLDKLWKSIPDLGNNLQRSLAANMDALVKFPCLPTPDYRGAKWSGLMPGPALPAVSKQQLQKSPTEPVPIRGASCSSAPGLSSGSRGPTKGPVGDPETAAGHSMMTGM